MNAMTIDREAIDARHGRYVARIERRSGEAELTFTRRRTELLSADHTFVPKEWRGAGIAMALVQKLIADARAEGFKIIPLCPFIRSRYQDHPEWADVMAAGPGE